MKLTKSTDFALRLLIHLALDNAQHSMPDLAKVLGIPYNHLTKLVQALTKGGVVSTKQGKHGGVALFKEPSEITLKSVIFITEGPTQLVECFDEDSNCILDHSCQLKMAIFNVQEKIDSLFESISLQDLMGNKNNYSSDLVKEKMISFKEVGL